jgi:hypothetical protein
MLCLLHYPKLTNEMKSGIGKKLVKNLYRATTDQQRKLIDQKFIQIYESNEITRK